LSVPESERERERGPEMTLGPMKLHTPPLARRSVTA
jgi:hypothetical protein